MGNTTHFLASDLFIVKTKKYLATTSLWTLFTEIKCTCYMFQNTEPELVQVPETHLLH